MMDTPDPLEKPVTLPEEPEAVQVNVEPGTVEDNTILVAVAEQTWKLVTRLFTAGLGLTVTTTFCEVPGGQPNAVGVTW